MLQVVPKFVVCASLRDVINSAFPLAMEARRVSSLQASTATPPRSRRRHHHYRRHAHPTLLFGRRGGALRRRLRPLRAVPDPDTP